MPYSNQHQHGVNRQFSLSVYLEGFVWCIHKPESFSTYQTGVYASQLRDLVVSPHLLPVPPLPGQYASLKLLAMSSGQHLKEE